MATESAEAVEEIPEPIPNRSDVAKVIRTVALDRIAHTGMMLEKMNRQNRRVERYEKFAATGDVKDLDAPAAESEEDMGVAIGNEYHYHVQAPPAQQTESTPAMTAPATTVDKAKAKLWPIVMALAGTTFGGAGVGYIVNDLLKPAVKAVAGIDTDTITEMDFPEETEQ